MQVSRVAASLILALAALLGVSAWLVLNTPVQENLGASAEEEREIREPGAAADLNASHAVSRKSVPFTDAEPAEESSPPPPPEVSIPADSIPDPDPRFGYSLNPVHMWVPTDSWLNPTKRKFTPAEMQEIQEFVYRDGALAMELDRQFYEKINATGVRLIDEGRFDGRVNWNELSEEQKKSIPMMTSDWMKPVIFKTTGQVHSWIVLQLERDFLDLAELRRAGWNEVGEARARLREKILRMP
ncbi:MAG: hypothetical protein JNM84_11380 [Planctomycetes bacterium]|nr:hypothetical protein [Planctomycetota bacterium]